MADKIYSRQYAAGQELFRAGDRGRHAYFIESGRVAVSVERDGEKIVIAELGESDIVGEMSMIDDAPRSATVTALEDTEVIVIERSRFVRPLASADPMMALILRVVLARFRDAQHQHSGFVRKPKELVSSLGEIRALAFERINAERNLRRALEAEEFELHYQPIVALDTGHIAGFEALMRLRSADGSLVSPLEFIGLAEETGLIVELGRWSLQAALRDHLLFASQSADTTPEAPAPFMSVNVSALQFAELGEIDRLAGIIESGHVDAGDIKLEVTETMMVENFDHAVAALNRLKGLGVSIAIDDFGTGYSSLNYLHQFPLDVLKIDRAFVANMEASEKSRRVVEGVVHMAHALGMDIVAEGIEEQTQMEALRALGCHFGQGYFMARPLTVEDALDLIRSRPRW